jgi:eukaryotic-like serine/threonine-protein kinase
MELVEGPTLAARLDPGPLGAEECRAVGEQVADVLSYAHATGVVHRDVKPANVLMGTQGRAKLADFGIARLIGDTVRHTQTGQQVGTAAYLAPEQMRGEAVDGAADVYSLGLVLLEALSGRHAYSGTSMESALARLHAAPTIPPTVDDDLRGLLTAMTALEPTQRPSAVAVTDRLRAMSSSAVGAGPSEMPAAPNPATTMQMPATRVTAVRPTSSTQSFEPCASYADRAGDAVSHAVREGALRLRRLPQHQQGFLAALLALVILIVVVAVVSQDGRTASPGIPQDVPSRLEQPLSDLHEAVHGE